MTPGRDKTARIVRLARIASLLRDVRLAEFARLAVRRAEVERALDSLVVPSVLIPDAPTEDTTAPRKSDTPMPLPAALAHARWVLAERGRQISALSRLRAAEAPLRDAAAKAAGRSEALDRLARKSRR